MQGNFPYPAGPAPASGPAQATDAGAGAGQGGHQACASCKHQRKKCSENCELAPYFPADRTREFGQVHKIYGVSNLTKMLKANDSIPKRERCAETLMWEAEWRNIDPANGCYNEVIRLRDENAMLRRVIRDCIDCGHHPLPQPYRSPVQQPGPYIANGNNHDNNNGGGNLIRRGINNNDGNIGGAMHHAEVGGGNLISQGINNNDGNIGGAMHHAEVGGGNLIRQGINNNDGNIRRAMHHAEVVPQHMVNYPLDNGNLINRYHNPHNPYPPIHMHGPGGQGNDGHGAFYR